MQVMFFSHAAAGNGFEFCRCSAHDPCCPYHISSLVVKPSRKEVVCQGDEAEVRTCPIGVRIGVRKSLERENQSNRAALEEKNGGSQVDTGWRVVGATWSPCQYCLCVNHTVRRLSQGQRYHAKPQAKRSLQQKETVAVDIDLGRSHHHCLHSLPHPPKAKSIPQSRPQSQSRGLTRVD